MDLTQYTIYGLPALAVVTSIVGVAKKTGLPTKWAPAVSLAVSVGTGVGIALENGQPILAGVAIGVLLGAAACGMYDLWKGDKMNADETLAEAG